MTDLSNNLPVLTEPRDVLRQGLGSVKTDSTPAVHPVQIVQQTYAKNAHRNKKKMLASIHGVALPLKMEIEETILSRFQRLPGGPRSRLTGLNSLLGRDEEIEFEDYLNQPEYRTEMINLAVELDKRFDPRS